MFRYMLAGMLSVLLLAAVFALGVSLITPGEAHPEANAATTPADAPPPAAPAEPTPTPTPTPVTLEPLPKPVEKLTLRAAVKAAGCTLAHPPNEGAEHAIGTFTIDNYRSNPPTSGVHAPDWYPDGIYEAGTTPDLGMLVHTLEHGRINLQYAPGTPKETIGRLRLLVDELDSGYHILLFQNETDMQYAVAATAWDHLLGCPEMNEKVFDAIRLFRNTYIDKSPEVIP